MLFAAQRMLRGAEWRELADFLSPAVFDVVAPKALAAYAASFLRNQLDAAGARRARTERERLLLAHRIPVALAASVSGQLPVLEAERRARGDAVLRLYFHQLLAGPEAFLHLGPSRFSGVNPVVWSPTAARHAWTPEFRVAVRDLYAGFYSDDGARFDSALATLGLTPAREVFLSHFGGDTTAVRFSGQHFRDTFHAAFVACRNAGSQIHPDFLPMGLMLASVYAHLEELDLALDVRAAWHDAVTAASGSA